MKRCCIIGALSAILIATSCHTNHDSALIDETPTLSVDLNDSISPTSFSDLFERAEAIPLETSDSTLLVFIKNIEEFDSLIYVLNWESMRQLLLVFDQKGNFVRQIGSIGQGPGEYTYCTDFCIDRSANKIYLLSTYDEILKFDITGKYLGNMLLPPKMNYSGSIKMVDDSHVATQSYVYKEEDAITVFDTKSHEVKYSTWKNDFELDMQGTKTPFHNYNGDLFYAIGFSNIVYKLSSDTIVPAYQWDFGKDNIDPRMFEKYSDENQRKAKDVNQFIDDMINDIQNGTVPYRIFRNLQNNQYYYTCLKRYAGLIAPSSNVFYRKTDGKAYVFDALAEGITLRPIYMNDDFLITELLYEQQETYKQRIDPDYMIRSNEDNPTLLKLYFKHK